MARWTKKAAIWTLMLKGVPEKKIPGTLPVNISGRVTGHNMENLKVPHQRQRPQVHEAHGPIFYPVAP